MIYSATGRSSGRVLVTVVAGFALGFIIAASIHWISPLKRGFNIAAREFQEAYLALYDASLPTPSGSAEYLVFLNRETDMAAYMSYFDLHPDIDFLSDSIYPNAVRIALKVPVDKSLGELKAQPFARFVIKNYPFLLCH